MTLLALTKLARPSKAAESDIESLIFLDTVQMEDFTEVVGRIEPTTVPVPRRLGTMTCGTREGTVATVLSSLCLLSFQLHDNTMARQPMYAWEWHLYDLF